MGLIIQHNTTAMTAKNKMKKNVTGLKKSSEKLSTGYKINRAADNASGLAVSEKMRSQIRGLSQATNNASDGISLIQTADGALEETHDILQRMRELAVQSANGTYTDEDRVAIQHEVDALKGELSRISESTEFNEMKLLNGELNITVNSEVENNEYGALYGSISHNLAIGGGAITVTGSVQGMYINFTTDASGKGGENAYWSYDVDKTDSELTQHVTINLAKGEKYTDKQIQELIDKANCVKGNTHPYGKITFKSETGFINAAEATTYGLEVGMQKQSWNFSGSSVAKTLDQSEVTYTDKTRTSTKNVSVFWDDSTDASKNPISYSGNSLYLNPNSTYNKDDIIDFLKDKGVFNNTNTRADGSKIGPAVKENIRCTSTISPNSKYLYFSYTDEYEHATFPSYATLNIKLEANQYGSYDEHRIDEEKYKQPDCIDDINHNPLQSAKIVVSDSATEDIQCSVDENDDLIVTLKEGFECTDSSAIENKIESFLAGKGYNYSVTISKSTLASNVTLGSPKSYTAETPSKFVAAKSGEMNITSTVIGQRYVKRVGTLPGQRQVIEGSLRYLLIDGEGNGSTGYSDYISFTAKTYGKSSDYDSLAKDIAISTDVGAGEEMVETDPTGEHVILHLSTGVEYTNEDIEELLEKAGYMYEVSLTDKVNPDGDRNGIVKFNEALDGSKQADGMNETSGILLQQTVSGKGVGFEDISVIKEGITFQIGANGTEDQQVTMKVEEASAEKLGVASLDVTTAENADKAIEQVDKAIKQVSEQRAKLGALQNRLTHSVSSLSVAETNLTAAESQIRDTDIATEMITYTKNNILQQATQAMLSQANQQTEGILQLLG